MRTGRPKAPGIERERATNAGVMDAAQEDGSGTGPPGANRTVVCDWKGQRPSGRNTESLAGDGREGAATFRGRSDRGNA